MQPTIWHAMVGVSLIGAFFTVAGLVAYLLYGPGITITIPNFFGLNISTSTAQTLSGDTSALILASGVLFECEGDKALKAEFLESSVRLALSDSRQISLPQTISVDGMRYANTDESFVFWDKDGIAFVEESGVMTYTNCVRRQ